ncbi:MAG TPA: 5-dehydro-2-deoxygluconokinase, partial [Rhodanobacteraceae bacterium]|nr:5-dehydro-2-deoxygluconokinase [Rhodanobacteraceae bacterium]
MTEQQRRFDLVAIGRSCIDLYGQQLGGRLEDMQTFAKYIGGSPTNSAVGAARLGLKSALVTRVGNDHFGRFIVEQLEREGVATEGVIGDDARLTALVFLGIRDAQTFPLIFYRENCADMALDSADIDPDMLRSTRAVLINGTHLSRPNVFDASMHAARMARDAGARVVFDIDYRPVLWGLAGKDRGEDRFVADAGVTARLQQVLPLCDLIVGTEEELHILGGSTDTLVALREIRAKTAALLVCKRGALGCVAFPGAIPAQLDAGVVGRGFRIEVFNVLGAGDAFMAGFLRGWLRDESVETCCSFGNACGALVVSRHGCAPAMPSWEELQLFLGRQDWPLRLRDAAELEHLHRATTRAQQYPDLKVLAMDHRSQFEDWCAATGAALDRLPVFKALVLAAVERVAGGRAGFGVLLDGRYGWRGLELAADAPYWIGRPIEAPGSRPLQFDASADVATELATWPANHVVKCLVHYHPDDAVEMRATQVRQLQRLQDACRKTGHEWLLEVIASKHGDVDAYTAERALEQLYEAGLQPDWWKLEPASQAVWDNIEHLLARRDPQCRGVLVLGLHAPIDALAESLRVAADSAVVKGF